VIVMGMHRSGTSAVTGILDQLGITGPSIDDLIPASSSNARGHFESKILTRIDNQLLHVLGATWSAPPPLETGWERDRSVVALTDSATRAFQSTFPIRPMAWKDPRNCIVLPFWRSVLPPPLAAVLVYRDSLEVAHSLQRRDRLTLTHGLALWERYLRSACAALAGIPTFVIGYADLLDDPASTCDNLVGFLSAVGIDLDETRRQAAVDSLDAGLRHMTPTSLEPIGIIADSQRHLLTTLHSLSGAHHPWRSPDFDAEPSWVEDVLSLRRDYEVLNRQIRSSRAMRLVDAWWRVRGTRPSSTHFDQMDL
jgi:hypothetical protein